MPDSGHFIPASATLKYPCLYKGFQDGDPAGAPPGACPPCGFQCSLSTHFFPQDPGGLAESERGSPRRLPDAEVHVCWAAAGKRSPGLGVHISVYIHIRDPRLEVGWVLLPRGWL